MSIVVKNSELNDDAIGAINQLIDMDINASTAFKLTRIIKELSSIVEDKVKMEKKILEKWTQKDDQGNVLPAKDDQGNIIEGAVNIIDPNAFTQEMSILMNTDNELPFDKINFEDLNLNTAKVKDLIKIDFLFN
jgi:hypothetical protein